MSAKSPHRLFGMVVLELMESVGKQPLLLDLLGEKNSWDDLIANSSDIFIFIPVFLENEVLFLLWNVLMNVCSNWDF